jgi:hypothetical protein
VGKRLFLYLLLLSHLTISTGFLAGTKVATPLGYTTIELIGIGDYVKGIDRNGNAIFKMVKATKTTLSDQLFGVQIADQTIGCCQDQRWFLARERKWVSTLELDPGNHVYDINGHRLQITLVQLMQQRGIVYDLHVEGEPNYFVTEREIVVHNFAPVVIGLGWAFGAGAIEFVGASGGVAVLGTLVGLKLHRNKNAARDGDTRFKISIQGMPDPEDPEEDDLIERFKKNNVKRVRTRFGNMYQDSETGFWWSRDRAGHGGSKFKVFKETSKGLEWIFDADSNGAPIVSKHKGPKGMFISKKDLIKCP